jgi:hypothetical protein
MHQISAAVRSFYEHLCGHHGFTDPDEFAASRPGAGRSTVAMLEAIAQAAATKPIVVVGGDPVGAEARAAKIRELQDKLGIFAQPVTVAPSPFENLGAVVYIDPTDGEP